MQLTIELNELHFYAHHGLYEEEKTIGAEYEVNVCIVYTPETVEAAYKGKVIDYPAVYELIKQYMQQPNLFLETIVMNMTRHILQSFPQAEKVTVRLQKKEPPLTSFEGTVFVSFTQTKSEL